MLTVAHGQRSNFPNFPPISELTASASHAMSRPTFLLKEALYIEGPLFLLFISLLFRCCRCCFFFLALAFSSQPPSSPHLHAHQEGCTQSEYGEKGGQKDGSQVGSFIF
jgi:hypothetical protein